MSDSAKIRFGCSARWRSPSGWDSRWILPWTKRSRRNRGEIARSSPARLIEEYTRYSERERAAPVFGTAARLRLLEAITPELQRAADSEEVWQSLARLDAYRRRFEAVPDAFTNPILLGSLLVPVGFAIDDGRFGGESAAPRLGLLPVARRDIERLHQMLALQRRLRDPNLSARAAKALVARGAFPDALAWLEIHGDAPDAVARWRTLLAGLKEDGTMPAPAPRVPARRRRRRGPRRPVQQ